MKRVDIYIFRNTIKPFFGALLVTTMILLLDRVFDLMDMIIKKGLPFNIVSQVMLYSLPFILSMTIPMSVFVGCLVAFGRMAQDLEFMAIQSSGISINRAITSVVIASVVLTFGMFWFNDRIVPESNYRLKNLLLDIVEKRPTAQIKPRTFSQVGNFWIYVEKKDDKTGYIEDIVIQQIGGSSMQTVVADYGTMFIDTKRNLNFILNKGYIHNYDNRENVYKRIRFFEYRIQIPLNDEIIKKQREWRSDMEKSVKMLISEINRLEKQYEKSGKKDKGLKRIINSLWIEVHRKFSMPVASIIFVFLAAYIGFVLKRGGYGPAFGISFFVFVVYYIFLISGQDLGKRGIIPPHVGMWWANVFYAVITGAFYKIWVNQ